MIFKTHAPYTHSLKIEPERVSLNGAISLRHYYNPKKTEVPIITLVMYKNGCYVLTPKGKLVAKDFFL